MRAVVMSVLLAVGASTVASSAEQAAARGGGPGGPGTTTDLSGTYWATEYHPKLQPVGGGDPPLNDAGKAAYERNRKGLRDKSLDDPTRTYCLPDGIPRLLSTPYPFQVYQLPPGQVTFVHELNNQVRVIPLDAPLPTREVTVVTPVYEGYSTGRYEGTVLVIRSVGFNDQTFLDSSGLPHGDQLETTERVRRIGNQLEDLLTIHDPEFYTRDWQARFVYERRPGLRLQEYVCGEPHRDISHIKGIPEIRDQRAKGLFP
jgi:hypothetical protein